MFTMFCRLNRFRQTMNAASGKNAPKQLYHTEHNCSNFDFRQLLGIFTWTIKSPHPPKPKIPPAKKKHHRVFSTFHAIWGQKQFCWIQNRIWTYGKHVLPNIFLSRAVEGCLRDLKQLGLSACASRRRYDQRP